MESIKGSNLGTYTYRVEPYQGNAQGEAPLSLLVQWILDAATRHAESWGIGYSTLIRRTQVWVLARLGLELDYFPVIGESFRIETWIESFNKHFSMRNFAFIQADGKPFGYARTIWSIIDLETRTSVDIESFEFIARFVNDRPCPIEKLSRLGAVHASDPICLRVQTTDIDLNRHQNSVKYIDQMINLFPLERFDRERIGRFEINYSSEAQYGMVLELHREEIAEGVWGIEIKNEKIGSMCRGKILFLPRA